MKKAWMFRCENCDGCVVNTPYRPVKCLDKDCVELSTGVFLTDAEYEAMKDKEKTLEMVAVDRSGGCLAVAQHLIRDWIEEAHNKEGRKA